MAIALIIVGAILIVAALQGNTAQLATELQTDATGYFKMGAGIAAVLALGFVPGLEKPSRWLFGLMMLAIFLANYSAIFQGLTQFAGGSGVAAATPTASSGTAATTTPAATPGQTTSATVSPQSTSMNPLDPSAYLAMFEVGFGGASHP